MSKLKATKSGKAGKHKGQDTFATVYARSLRKGRVMTGTDRRLFDFILRGSDEEEEGALAGKSKKPRVTTTRIVIVRATRAETPRAPMVPLAAG